MESSQFSDIQQSFEAIEQLDTQGATCDTFRVRLYGKLHFLKRLKPEQVGDIRYQEAFRKEFETGYRLEHPNLVRYVSLTANGILMEYIDGVTLAERLAQQPEYFLDKHNTHRFVSQLLDVVGYLHSHQVLHLDLKPDNILLTRINNDVKLIDLGCCYTDTFTDTQGRTNRYAAPEQLSGEAPDVRTDIYAIGKILERLPNASVYNKVIARCTASDPSARYQSIEEILHDINHQKRYYRYWMLLVAIVVALVACFVFLPRQNDDVPVIQDAPADSVALPEVNQEDRSRGSVHQNHGSVPLMLPELPSQPSVPVTKNASEQMEKELDRLLDSAYRSTIATFCDSVFPSLTVGRQWEKETSEFHAQALQAAADISRKYPDISESIIMQHVESRFQSLVSYVFNKMSENGAKQ